MERFYHGTSVLFDKFDLAHALEGDGKVKFGYGVYVTQMYKSAAHYSCTGSGKAVEKHYVYTVEVPDMTDDNHIWSNKPVHPEIVKRACVKLCEDIPTEVITAGKLFRKYIGNRLIGMKGSGTSQEVRCRDAINAVAWMSMVKGGLSKFMISVRRGEHLHA